MRKIMALFLRHREHIAYAAGVLTTLVNYAVCSVLTEFCNFGTNLSNIIA